MYLLRFCSHLHLWSQFFCSQLKLWRSRQTADTTGARWTLLGTVSFCHGVLPEKIVPHAALFSRMWRNLQWGSELIFQCRCEQSLSMLSDRAAYTWNVQAIKARYCVNLLYTCQKGWCSHSYCNVIWGRGKRCQDAQCHLRCPFFWRPCKYVVQDRSP